jgi:hypothetical protein
MKNLILGFIAGFLIAALTAIPVFKYAIEDKYESGHSTGVLDGTRLVLDFLDQHFEVQRPPETCKDSLVLKVGAIYVTESAGQTSIVTTTH